MVILNKWNNEFDKLESWWYNFREHVGANSKYNPSTATKTDCAHSMLNEWGVIRYDSMSIEFENEEDALAFLLRWA